MKSALLIRLGGLGDVLVLTPVAIELKKRGYEVDLCAGSPTCDVVKLLSNTGLFRKIIPQNKHFTGLDIYKIDEATWAGTELLKSGYDLVVDYKFSIELNSHYRQLSNSPGKEWFLSQNSNYMNWCDVMLAWAGIDPTTVADDDKIPVYKPEESELEWAKKTIRSVAGETVISMQTNASSLVRTWYNAERLPKLVREQFSQRKVSVVFFDGQTWNMLRGEYSFPIRLPEGIDPIRASSAIVACSDVFIGADSGFSHIAEAVGVPSITIYTTVPAWTRIKYYKHAKSIEPIGDTFAGVQCRPCFVLDRYCPRVREKALAELTEREKQIGQLSSSGISVEEAAKELNTTPQGMMMEGQMMQKRVEALLEMQAPCAMTITPERIMVLLKEIIG